MAADTHLKKETEQIQDIWNGGTEPMKASYGKLMMWYFILSDAFTFASFLIMYAALRMSSEVWPDPNAVFNSFPFLHGTKLPLGFVTVMTFILILSSVFVVRAVQEGHRMNQKGVLLWMFLGILGGLGFLGCQAWEWNHLIHQGMTFTSNPFGHYTVPEVVEGETVDVFKGYVNLVYDHETEEFNLPADGKDNKGNLIPENATKHTGTYLFGCLFFFITGFHGFHVTTGVLLNIMIWIQSARGVYQRRGHYEMVEKVGLYWHFVDLVWVFVFLAFYLL
jgi:cytochrome c oxidase subunit III